MPKPIIEIDNVTAGYEGQVQIENISATVFAGDFVAVTGPNGGGKTTLMKVVLGLLCPMNGEVRFYRDGVQVNHLPIGYLPQYSMIDKSFPISVRDVVLSGLIAEKSVWRNYSKEQHGRAAHIMDELDLAAFADNPIRALSGGELQRVLLARAIIRNPELLILDEPNTYIDAYYQQQMYEKLKRLNERCTIIVVSHDKETIERYANRVIGLNKTLCL